MKIIKWLICATALMLGLMVAIQPQPALSQQTIFVSPEHLYQLEYTTDWTAQESVDSFDIVLNIANISVGVGAGVRS